MTLEQLWPVFTGALGVLGGISLLFARLRAEQRARDKERQDLIQWRTTVSLTLEHLEERLEKLEK